MDANIVVKDALLRSRKWSTAQEAVSAERLRLVLPEVARLEAVGGYQRSRESNIAQIRKVIRKSTRSAREAASGLLSVYSDEMNVYEDALNARLVEIGFEVRSPPEVTHLEVTKRAISRLAPFNESGGGYRDTLVWLTALDQVQDAPFDDLILVSEDSIFSKHTVELAEELRQQTGASLTVASAIDHVDFPGEFEEEGLNLVALGLSRSEVADRIREVLDARDVSRWSPVGIDHATVGKVREVHFIEGGELVKKRYGLDVFEVVMRALVDVEVEIIIIHDVHGEEVDYSRLSANWNLDVEWRAEFDLARHKFSGDDVGEADVLGVIEH
uniref:PIN domain-containing protein n=1 Tax=Pseudoclavibacter sp. RFBI5 TaxID=2080578 RepID=UPI0021586858|nr:PIN domain-containing protein [Pseudoclavibacter sp. RFBI5]